MPSLDDLVDQLRIHFEELGYQVSVRDYKRAKEPAGITACKQGSEGWFIIVKSDSEDIGTDIDTAVGQLLRCSTDEKRRAIAVPEVPRAVNLLKRIPDSIRKEINLHIVIIGDKITIYEPAKPMHI